MHARTYVGRVGGLAVALGVGAAVMTGGYGTASAETTGESSTSSDSSSTSSDSSATSSDSSSTSSDAATDAPSSTEAATNDSTAPSSTEDTPSSASDKTSESTETDEAHESEPPATEAKDAEGTPEPTKKSGLQKSTISNTTGRAEANATTVDKDSSPSASMHEVTDPDTGNRDLDAATTNAATPASSSRVTTATVHTANQHTVAVRPEAVATEAEPTDEDSISVTPVNAVVGALSNLVNTVLSPFAAATTPEAPAQMPGLWAMLAFARREFEAVSRIFLGGNATPLATSLTTEPQTAEWDAAFTGEPSFVTQALVAGLRVFTGVGKILRIDPFTTQARLLSSTSPPPFLTFGLNVQRSEFEGIPVWALQPVNPSGEQLVAIHGGAFAIEATVIHWLDYTWMAHATGATVIVPIYPMVPTESGTAANVIPKIADLISAKIDEHGAANVSVYGDSAGATIGLAAVQELVRRGDAVPASMVLLSPVLDLTLRNPNIALVDDPVLDPAIGEDIFPQWAGDLEVTDPLVSPLYGSLDGLPPTWIYSGSLDILAPDTAVLRERALAEGADNLNFVLRKGLIHDWALPISPEGFFVRNDIYRQLFGTS